MRDKLSVFRGARLAFDLDGTLVDTAPDLVRALNDAVVPDGLKPVSIQSVRAMVGRGARALIVRAYQDADLATPDDETIEQRLSVFMDSYRSQLTAQSVVFDGVVEALEMFQSAGAELSVCTNKPSSLAVPVLEQVNLVQYFVRIIGPEDAPAKKPDGQHIETAIGGASDASSLMIGDSEPDVLAAKNAGAGSLIFTKGYSEKPAHTLGADRLFEAWSDLPGLAAKLIEERQKL